MLSAQDWHQRYLQQARWTQPLRQYLYKKVELSQAKSILEIGCGTGALLAELSTFPLAVIHGLDIAPENLNLAADVVANARLICGDAHQLPYANNAFDIVYCHFLLLWVEHPGQAVREMLRVARPGGVVLALAEPDYAGRIDFPEALSELGKRQAEALRKQGANPDIGRQLASLFAQAGLRGIEAGVLGSQWKTSFAPEELELEWKVLYSDLLDMVGETRLKALQEIDTQAWQSGTRILFVPTFYAWGQKP